MWLTALLALTLTCLRSCLGGLWAVKSLLSGIQFCGLWY